MDNSTGPQHEAFMLPITDGVKQLETRKFFPIGVLILLSALAVRLLINPLFHGFEGDLRIYGEWGQTLVSSPLSDFYSIARSPDHLPGDMYIHWATGELFTALGGQDFQSPQYRFMLKTVPAIFDCLLVILAWKLLANNRRQPGNLLLFLFAFSPALIFLSSVWGQWDSVSLTIFMVGLVLLWNPSPRFILASVFFAWALMIKPPLFLPLIPVVAGFYWTSRQQTGSVASSIAKLIGMFITASITITTLMYPFGMTWFARMGDLSLEGTLRMAGNLYPYTTLGAANIWMIPFSISARITDDREIAGISFQAIGLILMALATLYILIRMIKERLNSESLLWAMAALSYAYFLLPTRSHERYLLPAVVFLGILAAWYHWNRKITGLFLASTVLYTANLAIVYKKVIDFEYDVLITVISLANLAVFVILLTLQFGFRENPRNSPPVEAHTKP